MQNKKIVMSCGVILAFSQASVAEPAHSGLVATADSAATLYVNPAGLVKLEDKQLDLQVIAGFAQSEFSVGSTTTNLEGTSDSDGALAIPAVFYAFPVNDKWTAGLSFNVPGGIGSDFGEDWEVAACDQAAAMSNPNIKVAVVASGQNLETLAMIYKEQLRDSPWQVGVFNNVEAAQGWAHIREYRYP